MKNLVMFLVVVLLAAVGQVPLANASDIPFEYTELDRERVYSTGVDFDSWADLKSTVKEYLKEYECPQCKGHQCKGALLHFHVRKVDIYKEVEKPKLFGGTKKVDEFVKTVWRVEGAYLKQKDGGLGLLSDESEGYIKCTRKSCGWETRGGTKPKTGGGVVWLSINDITTGNWRNKVGN